MICYIRSQTYLSATGKYNGLLEAEREAAGPPPCGQYSFSPSTENEPQLYPTLNIANMRDLFHLSFNGIRPNGKRKCIHSLVVWTEIRLMYLA